MTGNVNLWQFLFELMHVRTLGCYRLLEKKKKGDWQNKESWSFQIYNKFIMK